MDCILHKSWTPKLIPIIVMILSSIVGISPGNAYKYLALGSLLSAQVQKNGTGLTVHYGTRRPSLSPHHGFNNGLHHQGPAPAAPPALNSAVFFLLRHVRPPWQRPPCRVRRKRETSCDPSWVQCFCRKGSYHLNKMLMQMIITNELLSFIIFNMNDHCPRNYAIFHNFYGNSAIFWTIVEQLHWFKSMIFYRIFSCYTLLLTWSSANCWWSLGLWFLIPACIHVKTN